MEDLNNQLTDSDVAGTDFALSNEAVGYLDETRKWTLFLSVIGFIFIGIIVIFALFAGTLFSNFGGSEFSEFGPGMSIMITVVYLLMAVLYFFPIWFLFNFSRKMKSAIQNHNGEDLTSAFSNLKSCYKFWGILMIIMLGFYALAAVFGGIGAAMM